MRIGIGVTTYNRTQHLELWSEQLNKCCNMNTFLLYKGNGANYYTSVADKNYAVYVAHDTENRKGIAYRKNECLRALKDCDYIFLFDDDTLPIKEGWAEFFIEASKASGQQHFQYLRETQSIKCTHGEDTIVNDTITSIKCYTNTSGCLMFMTKECIEKVGAYNVGYGIYGFEHADYSRRIHRAGLTPLGAYSCPSQAGEYIYAMDLDNHLPFNEQVKHKSSLTMKEALDYSRASRDLFVKSYSESPINIPL